MNALPGRPSPETVTQPPPEPDRVVRYTLLVLLIFAVIAFLWVAKGIALPLVAGIIFGVIFGPTVDRLVRWGMPQGLAAGLIVLAGVLIMTATLAALAAPFAIWSDQLPQFLAALEERLANLLDAIRRLGRAAEQLTPNPAPRVALAGNNPVVDLALNSTSAMGGILVFIGTVYFFLASRRTVRASILRLCLGRQVRQLAGEFFQEVERRIASYFAVVTLINLGMGLATGLIAWAAGLPLPLLWAVGGFLLNYVAYVGPAVLFGLLLGAGLVQHPTLAWAAAWPALAYLLVNTIEGNFLTPMAVGRWLTVAPFLIFVSIVFWLWLWGPLGAILSTPLLLIGAVTAEVIATYPQAREEDLANAPRAGAADDPT
jgi:predicted PurR-regulated permease PerM